MQSALLFFLFFFFNDTATTEIYTLSLHDALPIYQDGTRFVTRRAHLNVSDNTAEGHEPVEGHGPSGDIAGEGFVILSKGETIIFTGQSSLVLRGVKPDAPATKPPALPAEIEKLAAEIAANPQALPVAMPMPTLPPGALGKPTHGKPAGKSAA